jgi:hypothetical protein
MRANASVPQKESPWEFDPDAPAERLPRADERDAGGASAESFLGG